MNRKLSASVGPVQCGEPVPGRRSAYRGLPFACVGVLVLTAVASAQPYSSLRSNIPDVSGSLGAISVDVDGDGALDLLLLSVGFPQENRVYLNDGAGRFSFLRSQPPQQGFRVSPRRLERLDIDGDGDADLLIDDVFQTQLLRNDGLGSFTMIGTYFGELVGVDDLNGDGALDLVGLASVNRLEILWDVFTPAQATQVVEQGVTRAALADLDGDGDSDLFVNRRWFENVQPGSFVARNAARIAPSQGEPVAVADLDGDGREEILLNTGDDAQVLNLEPAGFQIGATVFEVGATLIPTATFGDRPLVLRDMDGDGLRDVVSARGFVARALGGGAFDPYLQVSEAGGGVLAVEDFDRDGRQDLLFASDSALVLQTRPGQYVRAGGGVTTDGGTAESLIVDMDLDGREDIVTNGSIRFRGERRFELLELSELTYAAFQSPWVGDFDGDGDPDVAATRGWYRNDGARNFQFVSETYGLTPSSGLLTAAVGDFDGDQVDDLVAYRLDFPPVGFPSAEIVYLRADGFGGFDAPQSVGQFNLPVGRLLVAELNNDGIPDVVVGGNAGLASEPIRTLLSDGSSAFASTVISTAFERVIDAADDDGDGFVDLRCEGGIFLNVSGTGSFVPGSLIPFTVQNEVALSYVDVDGDGTTEALMGQGGSRLAKVADRSGSGGFVIQPGRELPIWPRSVVRIDLDDDGDMDLTNGGSILMNLESQLHVPFLGRVGGSVDIELQWRPGANPQQVAAAVFASPRTARIPVPSLGVLALDPAVILPVGSAQIPAPDGFARLQRGIAASPSLVGVTFPIQAIFLPQVGSPRLSNVAFIDIR